MNFERATTVAFLACSVAAAAPHLRPLAEAARRRWDAWQPLGPDPSEHPDFRRYWREVNDDLRTLGAT